MSRESPVGWPLPDEVAELLRRSGTMPTSTVARAALISVRPWSVVYAVDLDVDDGTIEVVVKCIREPHHSGPAQGDDFEVRSELELRTLQLATDNGIPMPRPYGALHEVGGIVMQRVPERHLRDLRRQRRAWTEALSEVGQLCRRWNSIGEIPFGADRLTAAQVHAELCVHASRLAADGVWPVPTSTWGRLTGEWRERCDDQLAPTHGDLHAGNVWLDGEGRPFFVDGAIVAAHPVADIAKLAASLRAPGRRRSPTSPRLVRARVAALRAGYGAHDRWMFALHELHPYLAQWNGARAGSRSSQLIVDRLYARGLRGWLHDQTLVGGL